MLLHLHLRSTKINIGDIHGINILYGGITMKKLLSKSAIECSNISKHMKKLLTTVLIFTFMAMTLMGCAERKTYDIKTGTVTTSAESEVQDDRPVADETGTADTTARAGAEQDVETADSALPEMSDGPVQLTTSSGTELTLTPAAAEDFLAQDDNVTLETRIGTTVFKSGSQAFAGSALSLETMRSTETIEKPLVAFTYESSSAEAADAIGEAGASAVLMYGGSEYSVQVAWIGGDMACFFFGCEELPSSVPLFGVQDGTLYISFDGASGAGTDSDETQALPTGIQREYEWESYTLTVEYAKEISGSEVDPNPTSNIHDDEFVEIRIVGKNGDIALTDIQDNSKIEQFILTDAGGNELSIYTIRYWGIGFDADNGDFSLNDEQEGFTLIYRLPEGVTVNELTLSVSGS